MNRQQRRELRAFIDLLAIWGTGKHKGELFTPHTNRRVYIELLTRLIGSKGDVVEAAARSLQAKPHGYGWKLEEQMSLDAALVSWRTEPVVWHEAWLAKWQGCEGIRESGKVLVVYQPGDVLDLNRERIPAKFRLVTSDDLWTHPWTDREIEYVWSKWHQSSGVEDTAWQTGLALETFISADRMEYRFPTGTVYVSDQDEWAIQDGYLDLDDVDGDFILGLVMMGGCPVDYRVYLD